jgi:ATP-dependent DNA helicase RecQ
MYQQSEEVLLIGEEDNFSLVNKYMQKGASIIVVDSVEIDKNFDLILNMHRRSNIMIISLKEYRELRMQNSDYYISGGAIALYDPDNNNKYERYRTLKKYQNGKIKIVHLMVEDYYLSQVQKPISSVIEGPKIDSYIMERM